MTATETTFDAAALSEECTRVIQAVPGVSAVYRADPLVTATVKTVVDAVKRMPGPGHLVRVTHDETGVAIIAVIGTDGSEPAPVVCRRVHSAVLEYLKSLPDAFPVLVRVKVGRVG